MGKERRKFKRFDAYMTVNFRAQDAGGLEGAGLSQDLSRNGIKMSSAKTLPSGALVDLEIRIPDDPRTIRTTGKVMWTREAKEEKDSYEHGVCFLMMDPVDKFRALDYAYNHWLETKVNDYADPEEISETS